MKRVLICFAVLRLAMFALAGLNGSLPYGGDAEKWPRSEDGFHYRVADHRFFDPMGRWDSRGYLTIAYFDYDNTTADPTAPSSETQESTGPRRGQSNTAFFPGYPWIVRKAHRWIAVPLASALGGEEGEAWVGTVSTRFHVAHWLNLILFLASIPLFMIWARSRFGPEIAERAALLLLLTPTSVVFNVILSEGAFLLFSLAAFLCAERRWWFAAACLAAYTATIKPVGGVIGLPLFLLYLEDKSWRLRGYSWLWLAVIPAAVFGVLLHMWEKNGNFFAYFDQQRIQFGHYEFPTLSGLFELFSFEIDGRAKSGVDFARDGLQIVFTAAAFWAGWRLIHMMKGQRGRVAYGAFVVLLLLMPLVSGSLLSMPRYTSTIFPLYCAVAGALSGRRFLGVLVGFGVGWALLWLLWIHNYPVLI